MRQLDGAEQDVKDLRARHQKAADARGVLLPRARQHRQRQGTPDLHQLAGRLVTPAAVMLMDT